MLATCCMDQIWDLLSHLKSPPKNFFFYFSKAQRNPVFDSPVFSQKTFFFLVLYLGLLSFYLVIVTFFFTFYSVGGACSMLCTCFRAQLHDPHTGRWRAACLCALEPGCPPSSWANRGCFTSLHLCFFVCEKEHDVSLCLIGLLWRLNEYTKAPKNRAWCFWAWGSNKIALLLVCKGVRVTEETCNCSVGCPDTEGHC